MKNNHFLAILFLFVTTQIALAQSKTFTLVDAKNNSPIPYATILFNGNQGSITNQEGVFRLNMDKLNPNAVVAISCIGYQGKSFKPEVLKQEKNATIKLIPSIESLETVHLDQARPHVDTIMKRVYDRLATNYKFKDKKYKLFYRNTNKMHFDKLDVNVTKNTGFKRTAIKQLNEELDALKRELKKSINASGYYADMLLDFYKTDKAHLKMVVEKAISLNGFDNLSTPESLQKDMLTKIIRNFEEDITYKVKTGWFKIEDSLSLKSIMKKSKDTVPPSVNVASTKEDVNSILLDNGFKVNYSDLNFVTEQNLYRYTLEDILFYEGSLVYKVAFKPRKSDGKYGGFLYVNEEDYAVLKTEYAYAKGKHGRGLNLKLVLGVKFRDTKRKVTVSYKKDSTGYYGLQHVKQETVKEMYVSRPMKLIANEVSKKLKFNFKVQFDII